MGTGSFRIRAAQRVSATIAAGVHRVDRDPAPESLEIHCASSRIVSPRYTKASVRIRASAPSIAGQKVVECKEQDRQSTLPPLRDRTEAGTMADGR